MRALRFLSRIAPDRHDRLRYLATLWVGGGLVLACATWLCFRSGLNVAAMAFVYLIIVILLSLLDSFISSAIFSAVAIACLDYFFVEPLFTFQVNYAEDLATLAAFLLTAFVVTGLVRQARDAAAALHRERARLLDLTQDAILVRDNNDVITYWNAGAEQLYGWARAEAIGKTKHELLQPSFPVSFEDAKSTLQRTGRWQGELVLTRRDGRRVTVESRWSLQVDDAGKPRATLENNHDVTERKRAQAELQRNQVAIDALPAFLTRYSAVGVREFINERGRQYHGISIAEGGGGEPWIAVHPDDVAAGERAWRHSVATGEPFEMEMRFRRADGEYRWHLNRRLPNRDPLGNILGWYGVAFEIEDQKLAEAALRRSESYLAEAQQLSHTGSFGWNTATGEVFWSDETFRIFGYDHTIMPSVEVVLARVHPDDVVLVRQVIEQAAAKREGFDFEHRLLLPDGTVKHLHVVAHAGPNRQDRQHVVGAVMDITASKEAFTRLEASERRYRDLFQHMPLGLTQIDASKLVPLFKELRAQGVTELKDHIDKHPDFLARAVEALEVEEVNHYNVELFAAKSAAEMRGPITRFWQPGLPTIRRSIEARYRGEEFFQEETKVARLDGKVIDVLFAAARPGAVADKSLVGFIDISERVKARVELEESEQRYREVFRHMPMGLAQIDMTNLVPMFRDLRAQGITNLKEYLDAHPEFVRRATDAAIVEAVNNEAVRMFGATSADEMLGPTTRFWEANFETVRRSFESRFRGEEFFRVETKMSTVDGRVIDVIFATGRIGAVANRALAGFVDITERVRAQEMLARVQADFAHAARVSMLGEFTASIAHEVNQPLAAIATNGEAGLRWLAKPEPDVAEVRDLTKRIVADARRAGDVIARVRAMAARRVPEQAALPLDEVIREALMFLRPEVQSRGVIVVYRPAASAPQVIADRTQLQQVIVNLAVNAMQAMASAQSRERRIVIRTLAEARVVSCSIEDSGPGIAPDHLGRLFESFFTTKEGGMGMGLPICRSIIEAHGGHIAADNGAEGGGARFTFTLPAAI